MLRVATLLFAGAFAVAATVEAPADASRASPAGVPVTGIKAELGRRLFYDADLSIDGTMACATCHQQRHGFSDGNRTHPGVQGDPGKRNVPGLANVARRKSLTWGNPLVRSLQAQAAIPLLGDSPVEMGMQNAHEDELARRLGRDACYDRMFATAFPERNGAIDMETVTAALAAFQRTLISTDAPYDRWRHGEADALSPLAIAGEAVFRRQCVSCHRGEDFTDDAFHRVSEGTADIPDHGLGEITGKPSDSGKFRTPGLRNVAVTGPYFHDGATPDLRAAIARHRDLTPDDSEADALIAFLGALTDKTFLNDPRFAYPDTACSRAF